MTLLRNTGSDDSDEYDIEDPYIGLEDSGSDATKKFVKEANKFCLAALDDPRKSPRYSKILHILEADERIPFISKMGEDSFYNLWKDEKVRWKRAIGEDSRPKVYSLSVLFVSSAESSRPLEEDYSVVV